MRISSSTLYEQAIVNIDGNQYSLAKLQRQLASGLRLQTASDDPLAAGQVMSADKALADVKQWQSNVTTLQNRLSLEDSSLDAVTQSLQQISTLAVQSNNSTLTDSDRQSLVAQMKQQLAAILAQANAQDGQGRYLFGGTQDSSAPFSLLPVGASYSGNSQMNSLPVAATRQIAGTDPGDSVFLALKSGDGQLTVAAGATNTGTAAISDAHVAALSQATGHAYSISFLGGNYTVTDTTLGTTVATGAYTANTAIQFDGLSVTLDDVPADGDTFQIGPAGQQDVFATVQKLVNLFSAPQSTGAVRAQTRTGVYDQLQALKGAIDHITSIRGGVGARGNALDDANSQLGATSSALQSTISGLQDLDYAAASTKLSQTNLALQAAEQSYVQIQGLSLFNYIK